VVRTQIDVILPSGVAVLNAEDAEVVKMAELCDGKVIFFGTDPQLDAIVAHRSNGERVVFQHNNNIVLAEGNEETALIPLTSRSGKTAQPKAVMAAVAAVWALNIAPDLIIAGLSTFDLNFMKLK
jgi:cyanophycin synthetase